MKRGRKEDPPYLKDGTVYLTGKHVKHADYGMFGEKVAQQRESYRWMDG